jgi:hypothetical protein
MIILVAALLGGIIGGIIAKRRKGAVLDILQYVAIYALAFSIPGLFITLIVHRLAL